MIQVGHLSRLECLPLARSRVTDAGLANIAKMPRLLWLFLEETNVTNAGLAHLEGITSL